MSRQLFAGKPPSVLRMRSDLRPFGWRDDVLRRLDPLSPEAFFVRKEPLSIAEAKALDRDCEALMRSIQGLPTIEEHEAFSAQIAQGRGTTPGLASTLN